MSLIRRLAADRKAIAALELALIMPAFLLLMLGAVDLMIAIRTWHTLDQVTAQVSEIVSKCESIDDPQDINVFMADGQLIANPMDITGGTQGALIISAIGNNSSGKTVVLWQKKKGAAQFSSQIGTTGAVANTGAYVLPDNDVLIAVEAISQPGLWIFSGAWMGRLQPTLYSQSMFLSRATDFTDITTLQTTNSTSGACTSS